MTPKSRPADREILRDTVHVLRPNRRDWSTATIVAPGPISERAREGLLVEQSCPFAGAGSMPTTRLRFGAFRTQTARQVSFNA
jgi:hypothetical protein